ncbi:hypothetical protein NEDG_00480 [Nematocida displodere]|uniref:Uncharacterized protein n=1 Tax=Nematocida displodere TaxID=1805483 RepID=A0A177EJ71_9MICR|nr:hypothetical protein NEDG_00480 [Nematocida displodere]
MGNSGEEGWISAPKIDFTRMYGNGKHKKKTNNQNKESMELKKHRIHWQGEGAKIDLQAWEESEGAEEPKVQGKDWTPGIFTPGPRAEPPFEVEMLLNLFVFRDGKEKTVFVLKIASLYTSWVVIKTIEDIVRLVKAIKKATNLLNKLDAKHLQSISPGRQSERESLVTLILSTILNNQAFQVCAQSFVLTNAVTIEEIEGRPRNVLVSSLRGDTGGVYLVEYRGWHLGWRCGLFQLYKNIFTRTSTRTGKVTETIDLTRCSISISGRTLKVKESQNERSFVANDDTSVAILKQWFFSGNECLV